MVAGVSVGLEDRTGIDANIFRLLFVLLTFASGAGVILYALVWLLSPPVGDRQPGLLRIARANVARLPEELGHVRDQVARLWTTRDRNARVVALALAGGGACLLLWSVGAFSWMTPTRLVAVAAIVGGLAVLVFASGRAS
jgi:phage shock protein PspC (stress-responsive transcriptional regulator)